MSPRNEDILRRYLAQENVREIGELYGISKQRVDQIVRAAGAQKREPKPKPPPKVGRFGRLAQEERNKAILSLRRRRLTLGQIAIKLRLPSGTVHGVVQRFSHLINEVSA